MPFFPKKKECDPDYMPGKSRRVGYYDSAFDDDRGNRKKLHKLLG